VRVYVKWADFLPLRPFGAFRVVVQELLNQIDVRQKHPAAAVPLQTEFVQRVPGGGSQS